MTPPNYFRWVRHASSGGTVYDDGHTLDMDENFETSGWGTTNYSVAGFSSQEDENFETSGWGITNYSAAGFSSQEDENFETTDWTDMDGDFWS